MRSLSPSKSHRSPNENQDDHRRGIHRREAGRRSPTARARPAAPPEPPNDPRREIRRVRAPSSVLSQRSLTYIPGCRLPFTPPCCHCALHHILRCLQIPESAAIASRSRQRRHRDEKTGRGARRRRPARQTPPRPPERQQELQDKSEVRCRAGPQHTNYVMELGRASYRTVHCNESSRGGACPLRACAQLRTGFMDFCGGARRCGLRIRVLYSILLSAGTITWFWVYITLLVHLLLCIIIRFFFFCSRSFLTLSCRNVRLRLK